MIGDLYWMGSCKMGNIPICFFFNQSVCFFEVHEKLGGHGAMGVGLDGVKIHSGYYHSVIVLGDSLL